MDLRIEPDLQYCPRCGDEYRADILTCATCEVDLLSGVAYKERVEQKEGKKKQRVFKITDDDVLVAIQKGPVLDIRQLQALLQQERIASVAVNEDGSSCGKGCCGTTLVLQVREGDVDDALIILQQDYYNSTGLADHDLGQGGTVYDVAAAEVTCPACGFTFSTSTPACPDCGLQFA